MAFFLPSPADSVGAWFVSADLLLLSWRLLQSFLGRSSRLQCWRAAQDLPWRTLLSTHCAKCASLYSLPGYGAACFPCSRRLESAVVCRSRNGQGDFRHWHRHVSPGSQRRVVGRVFFRLSLFAASGRGRPRSAFQNQTRPLRLRLRELF